MTGKMGQYKVWMILQVKGFTKRRKPYKLIYITANLFVYPKFMDLLMIAMM